MKVAGDPLIHSHNIIPNLMVTESGRVVSIHRSQLKMRVKEFGGVYQALFAKKMRAIGIDVELDDRTHMAKLPAIPEWVCQEFSKRSQDAEQAARDLAKKHSLDWDRLTDDQRISFVSAGAAQTRQGKSDGAADFEGWRAQMAGRWEHTSAVAYGPPAPAMSYADRMEGAFRVGISLFEQDLQKRAVVEGQDARVAMIRGLIAYGFDNVKDIDRLTSEMVSRGVRQDGHWTRVIVHKMDGGRVKMTTQLHAEQERELIRLAQSGAADRSRALTPREIEAAIQRTGKVFEGKVGDEQRSSINRLGTGGAASALIGAAGIGKTTMVLAVLVDAWKAKGLDVWGTANAWVQANALREAGVPGWHCRALQPLLDQAHDGFAKLNRNSVVVLDELGQVGTRQLLDLFRLQEKHGFQIVMAGSERQCAAIEAGPVIELLRQAWGDEAIPKILETVRQNTKEERYLAKLFHDGEVEKAIELKRWNQTAELAEGGYRQCVGRVAELYVQRKTASGQRSGIHGHDQCPDQCGRAGDQPRRPARAPGDGRGRAGRADRRQGNRPDGQRLLAQPSRGRQSAAVPAHPRVVHQARW